MDGNNGHEASSCTATTNNLQDTTSNANQHSSEFLEVYDATMNFNSVDFHDPSGKNVIQEKLKNRTYLYDHLFLSLISKP